MVNAKRQPTDATSECQNPFRFGDENTINDVTFLWGRTMPATLPFTLQNVNINGSGGINITTGTTEDAVFNEPGVVSVSSVAAGDTVTIGGFEYTYEYLGSHDVNGDPLDPAAYIQIISAPSGAPISVGDAFAIDLSGEPGDLDYPNLPNGNTGDKVSDLDKATRVRFPGIICFAAGTALLTPKGEVAVENLCVGDLVETADAGAQPIIWISSTKIVFDAENERHKPILVAANALGNNTPMRNLIVSPQHKILLASTDSHGVLAPAKSLTEQRGIRIMKGVREMEYFHVLLPAHSIVFSDGLATESFFPGETAMKMLKLNQRAAIEAAIPSLKKSLKAYGPKVRACLTRRQAEALPKGQHGFGFGQFPERRMYA